MNVCMVVYSGYEIDHRVRHYAEALAEKNEHVDVISLSWEHGRGKRGTLEGVQIYRVQEKVSGQKKPLTYLFNILLFFLKGSMLLLWRHIKHRYDVIHIHNMPDFLIFMGFVPKLLGAKIILDIHDVVPELYCQKFNTTMDSSVVKLLRFTEKICVHFADYVIVANDLWMKKIIGRDRIVPDKCAGILNYPDKRYFKRIEKKHADGYFTVVYPGTISHHHGIDIAIKAIAIAEDKIPNIRFNVYGLSGDPKYIECLDRLVEDMNIKDRVTFHGPVKHDELNDVYARSDIGIVPKRGGIFSSEAFSTKIFDFMAVGLPVIVSRTRIDEYYFDDSTVMYFEPENPEDLARCIIELYNNPGKRTSLIERGRMYTDEYNWDAKKSVYVDIVEKLVTNHHRRGGEQ
jgi:glycosyltransferase involved in cell wall biosynthesis